MELVFTGRFYSDRSGVQVRNCTKRPTAARYTRTKRTRCNCWVLFHVVHFASIAPPDFFKFIGRDFGYSVHHFFILSAFSLYHSTESRTNHPNWLPEYLIKRFFRIAPLFYCVIAFIIIRQAIKVNKHVADFDTILLNLTFTSDFVPYSGFLVWRGGQ